MIRLSKIREKIKDLNIDGIIINNPENRRYLSKFSGSSGALLISADTAVIITDFRYWEQVAQEVSDFNLHKQGPNLWQSIISLIQELQWTKVGFEAGTLTYQEYQTLCSLAPTHLQFVPLNDLVEQQRSVKDEQEIAILAKAAQITDGALAKTLSIIKPGLKERELALEFDYQLRLQGASGNSFTTIAISGERSALPHGVPSEKEIVKGDLVLIDCGALYNGYCADLTRTMVVGNATAEQKRLYQIVLHAQELALDYLKAGLVGADVDKVARQFLTQQGYGDKFGHGLGHSVGLNIHESPRLSITEQNRIPAGAVITVEPGVYLPGWGGIRIEDLVVVGQTGIRNLTSSPKQHLMEL
jgi:Xaa-Pro aminopeptidase